MAAKRRRLEIQRLQISDLACPDEIALVLRKRLSYASAMENPFHRIMVRRRAELGLSQAQAAGRAGVSRGTWNTWENVDELPHRDKWHIIARALEIPMNELMKVSSTSWFLQCGPSQFQLSMLEAFGITLDGAALADHNFIDLDLAKLDRQLDVDLERVRMPVLAQKLGRMRDRIRNILVTQDAVLQQLRVLVDSFREACDPNAPAGYVSPQRKKTLKVTKKPASGAHRAQMSE